MTDFGYSTIGASTDNPADNWIWLKATSTPASSGALTLIQAHCVQRNGTAATIDFALYSDSAGAPGSLLTATSHTAASVGAAFAWVSIDMSGDGFSVVSGTQYWFCMRVPSYLGGTDNDVNVHFDTNGSLTEGYFKTGGFTEPRPFPATATGSTSFANERWSIYGTFTAAAGGLPDGTRHMQPGQHGILSGW